MGVSFYASDISVVGFQEIRRWQHVKTGESRYIASPPEPNDNYRDMGVAFFAPTDAGVAEATNVRYSPVFRWRRAGSERYAALDLASAGYERHEIAFYAACPDRDNDTLTDCFESFLGTDASSADTDGDGLRDAYELDTPGCDPEVYNDDGDRIPSQEEVLAGTNPCF